MLESISVITLTYTDELSGIELVVADFQKPDYGLLMLLILNLLSVDLLISYQ